MDGPGRRIDRRDLLTAAALACIPDWNSAGMTTSRDQTSPGLIFGPGPAGAWDSERVSCPRVLRLADGTWRMWYYGRDPGFDRRINLPTGRVGLARSADGINWERIRGPGILGSVFDPHLDAARFDSGHVGISDLHYRDDLYWMWYFAGDRTSRKLFGMDITGLPLRPGCALSRDGLHWNRVEGPFQGALLDAGKPGEFDALMVAWPQVVQWDDGSWRMYYHTLDPRQRYILAWAESRDGLRWEKRGPVMEPGPAGRFDDQGIATRHILKLQGRWTMFYEGCRHIGRPMEVDRQIGVAVSDDGLQWERVDGPYANGCILPQAPEGSGRWDFRLGCPWVVPMADGSLRLYYIGSNERPHSGGGELDTVHQIGLAVSDGNITRWRRWEG
jgi:hypothetical protein